MDGMDSLPLKLCGYDCVLGSCICTLTRTHDRGQKLKEASEQQQFLRAVEDMEQWIAEMEGQMSSEDLGKDLISVNILIKKHAVSAVYSWVCAYCIFIA